MKLKLSEDYDKKNKRGKEFEILDIAQDFEFSFGIKVLVNLNGADTWLGIIWFGREVN